MTFTLLLFVQLFHSLTLIKFHYLTLRMYQTIGPVEWVWWSFVNQQESQKISKKISSTIIQMAISFFRNVYRKWQIYINSNRKSNIIQFLNQTAMKKMISEQRQSSVLKPYDKDYTDVSTQNSAQHSLDSSFQEKSSHISSQRNDQTMDQDSEPECVHEAMQDQAKGQQKLSKITYYKKAVEWLGKKYKRFKIKLETLYLAVSYMIKYIALGLELKHKCELLSAVCLLLAAKINEIHFPSIKSLLGALDFFTTKKELLQLEEEVVTFFGFELGVQRNSYSIVYEFFALETEQKRRNAQKLLYLSISNPETLQFGESYLGLSIVYLLKPESLKETTGINRDKMKKIAFIVYNMYREKKNQLANKENCEC